MQLSVNLAKQQQLVFSSYFPIANQYYVQKIANTFVYIFCENYFFPRKNILIETINPLISERTPWHAILPTGAVDIGCLQW
jgi:hypothetical protein